MKIRKVIYEIGRAFGGAGKAKMWTDAGDGGRNRMNRTEENYRLKLLRDYNRLSNIIHILTFLLGLGIGYIIGR